MRPRNLLLAPLTCTALVSTALADSTLLDLDRLHYDTVYKAARRAVLAVDGQGQPAVFLLRIARGQFLPPHGAQGPLRLLTVVSGTLSWGDGHVVDPAAERTFEPGSIIVLPAGGGEHWAAARHDDVLLQVVMLREGALAADTDAPVRP